MTISELVDDLCLPRNVRVPTDNGTTWATEDALLTQLLEAVSASIPDGGGGGGSPSARNLINTDALHTLGMIVAQVGDWCRMVGAPTTKDAATDLRSWFDRYSAFEGESLDAVYIRTLTNWMAQIRELLDPPKSVEITSACPECLEDFYVNAEGDPIPHPITLQYRANGVGMLNGAHATCRACGYGWSGEWELRGLSHAIG